MWMGLGLASLLLRAGHLFLFFCAAGVTLFWTLQTLTLFFMGLWRELMVCSGRQPVRDLIPVVQGPYNLALATD